jgi:YidC/Oxa1 family membrane protein insertase
VLAWDLLVDTFRTVLVVVAHALGGSLGSAIVAVSLAVRVLLLPLTLRVALRAREMQRRMRALQPELARLRKRHASDPRRVALETQALYRRNGVELVPRGTALLAAVQLPLGGALYRAIASGLGVGQRFAWIADLARPDALLAILAATLAGAAAASGAAGGDANGRWAAHAGTLASATVALVLVWRLSSGVGLYWAASSFVGVVQGQIVRRADAKAAPPPERSA